MRSCAGQGTVPGLGGRFNFSLLPKSHVLQPWVAQVTKLICFPDGFLLLPYARGVT